LAALPKTIDIWVDGSALYEGSQGSISLGAGWVRVSGQKLVSARSARIKDISNPGKNPSLIAEIKAVTMALNEIEGRAAKVNVYSDHGHVVDFINSRHLSPRTKRNMPEVVPFFNDLLRAVFRHSSVVAQRIDDMDPMADFHHAAHNLAASATGSKKRVSCPGLQELALRLIQS
jgi:ribonuclease HI